MYFKSPVLVEHVFFFSFICSFFLYHINVLIVWNRQRQTLNKKKLLSGWNHEMTPIQHAGKRIECFWWGPEVQMVLYMAKKQEADVHLCPRCSQWGIVGLVDESLHTECFIVPFVFYSQLLSISFSFLHHLFHSFFPCFFFFNLPLP